MEVCVWPKEWGLPSFDYKCLIVQAYIRFQKTIIEFQYCNNPYNSPNGDFPVFKNGSSPSVCGYKNILHHLKLEGLDLDANLNDEQRSLVEAYKCLIEEKLLPALEYFFWVESKCFTELVRPSFAKMLRIPYGLYTPIKFRNQIIKKLDILFNGLSPSEMENKIIMDAKETLNFLSNRLDSKDYIFGNKPCVIDAYIFGILAPFLKSNLPNSVIVNHIKACPNLVQLVNNTIDNYFYLSQEEYAEQKRNELEEERKKLNLNDNDIDFPNKKRNMALAAAICAGSMFAYALFVGVLKLEVIRPVK